MNEIRRALRPVRLRMRWIRFLKGMVTGVLVGAAACVALTAGSFFIPVRHRLWLSCLAVVAGGFLGALGNALRPVRDGAAAAAADRCGLSERVQTALQLARREDDFACLQREDALRALKNLPLRSISMPRFKKTLLITVGLIFIAGGLMLLPNAQNAAVEAALAFEARMQETAKTLEAQAQRNLSDFDAAQREDLTQTLRETAAALRRAEKPVDALLALNQAQRRMEDLQSRMADDAMRSLLDALDHQGMQELSQALSGGDEAQIAQALESADAEDLAQAVEEASSVEAAKSAQAQARMRAAAEDMRAGNLSDAASSLSALRQMAQTQAADRLSATARALANARQAVSDPMNIQAQTQGQIPQQAGLAPNEMAEAEGGAASGSGNQSSGAENPSESATSQSGSGAGTGRQESRGTSGAALGTTQMKSQADSPPRESIGKYESIYDPTHLNAQTRDEFAASPQGEGASAQAELGPGAGTQGGSVPYNEVVGEYADAAARAADNQNLTSRERDWVTRYFEALTRS